ncbi:hypothetical protein [Nocardioides sp.]|uniref:hypothetical protein n=1 Tax=Nocardioides sp. TaxID=35761 RepID=UPI0039E3DF07
MDDEQLRDRLRAADPAAGLTPLDPGQVTTLVEASSTPARRPAAWLVGAAAAVILVLGGTVFALQSRGGDPDDELVADPGPVTVPTLALTVSPVTGKCLVPTPELLRDVDEAFAGTVTAVDGDQVTITPTATFAGTPAETVTITAPTLPEIEVRFEAGGSYLVAATDGQVRGCGFSGPATAELQSLYDQAFPG